MITSEAGSIANTARGTTVTGHRVPDANFDFCTLRLFPKNFLDSGNFLECAADWFPHTAWNKVFAGMPEDLSFL